MLTDFLWKMFYILFILVKQVSILLPFLEYLLTNKVRKEKLNMVSLLLTTYGGRIRLQSLLYLRAGTYIYVHTGHDDRLS